MKTIINRLSLCLVLLLAMTTAARAADDILIADFEGPGYGEWEATGDAFGEDPAGGTLQGQHQVTGFKGKGLVNTFRNRDESTGTLTSPAFPIQRKYITFLIGGGMHDDTCMQLLVDGEVVAARSGENDERLTPAFFDVADRMGKTARLRIVDRNTGGWGHVNVDHIVLSDTKPEKPKNPFNIGKAGAPPYHPHEMPSDYKENWRPQFHFSPKNEWMNDINGLVYQNGVYHMMYQWGQRIRHGGYATSEDLIHWADKGVALVPQQSFLPPDAVRNISGAQKYSGSGVLASGEVAKAITGSTDPAIIIIYTGTNVGTCLAWSNDEGHSWHNFKDNPVANPTKGAVPRDPCVIWYEPEKKWVLAIYENGTTFYESADLINWRQLGNIGFGYECPDLFELPLDGDSNNMKWVICDASGKYLVGQFDGTRFIDENRADPPLFMDVGPDFYAGQTFFPHNLPEPKILQIAWMDEWNGGVGESKWQRNATFPVELGLVTREGRMRVTRTPIEAIRKLYAGDPVRISNKMVGSDNILKEIKSKAFDLTVELDLSDTRASEVVFKITDVAYRYDIAGQQLHYEGIHKNKFGGHEPPTLKMDDNHVLRLRMLVDWSSIEIFSDEGAFSFTHHVGFDPEDDSLSLTAVGGEVKLVDLKMHDLKSIWQN